MRALITITYAVRLVLAGAITLFVLPIGCITLLADKVCDGLLWVAHQLVDLKG
jgi:hypothetical protein